MIWLRWKLRVWLGIQELDSKQYEMNTQVKDCVTAARNNNTAIAALSLKVSQTPVRERKIPVYHDYESSQVEALKEFEENPNGVSR